MKRALLVVSMVLACASVSQAQSPCQIVAQKNPHPMDITVSTVMVMDTVNFEVHALSMMPFVVKNGDSVHFGLCARATDGMMHTSMIMYKTNMGTFSFNVSMKASTAAVSQQNSVNHVSAAFPNPASSTLNVQLLGEFTGATAQLFSVDGSLVATSSVTSASSTLDVAQLPSGAYRLVVNKGDKILSSQSVVVAH